MHLAPGAGLVDAASGLHAGASAPAQITLKRTGRRQALGEARRERWRVAERVPGLLEP